MSTSVNHLDERTRDSSDLLEEIMPSAITLAMMLRHRKMAAWLRTGVVCMDTSLPNLPNTAGFLHR